MTDFERLLEKHKEMAGTPMFVKTHSELARAYHVRGQALYMTCNMLRLIQDVVDGKYRVDADGDGCAVRELSEPAPDSVRVASLRVLMDSLRAQYEHGRADGCENPFSLRFEAGMAELWREGAVRDADMAG